MYKTTSLVSTLLLMFQIAYGNKMVGKAPASDCQKESGLADLKATLKQKQNYKIERIKDEEMKFLKRFVSGNQEKALKFKNLILSYFKGEIDSGRFIGTIKKSYPRASAKLGDDKTGKAKVRIVNHLRPRYQDKKREAKFLMPEAVIEITINSEDRNSLTGLWRKYQAFFSSYYHRKDYSLVGNQITPTMVYNSSTGTEAKFAQKLTSEINELKSVIEKKKHSEENLCDPISSDE